MDSKHSDIEASKGETQRLLPNNSSSSSIDAKDESDISSIWSDAYDTITLGIPIFFSMLSWVGMKTTDSALLGHVSAQALSAAALSDLWTMCSVVLMGGGVLSVLCSSAVGANNPKLAGIYLQVSYFCLSFVMVFVFICWNCTKLFWTTLGTDPVLADMAGLYASILSFSLPGQLIVGQLTQFFSSQRIMHPEVYASAFALCCNLLFGMILVLGIPIPNWDGFGFIACPIVTASVVYAQFFLIFFVYIVKQRLHEKCWNGWDWKEITKERIRTYCDLYIPAALSIASDFWRVAVIGIIAARVGVLEVAIFNTGYRIMWIVLIMTNALGSASAIKITTRLGKNDSTGAKQAGWVGIMMTVVMLACIGFVVLWRIEWLGRIFTNDEEFLQLFDDVKIPFVLTLLLMNLSVALERIPYSMGRTREIFWYGFVASWFGQVPGVYFLTTYWRDDLFGLYWGMCIGYGALAILYGYICLHSDWAHYAMLARQRSEMSDDNSS